MTTPFWCLLVAIFIPYVLAGVTVYFKSKQLGSVDFNNPRDQSLALKDTGARANAAQQNAWEALVVFAAAVLVAAGASADAATSSTASLLFVGARLFHAIFYILNVPPMRTLSFAVGLGSCVWLFVLAAQTAGA